MDSANSCFIRVSVVTAANQTLRRIHRSRVTADLPHSQEENNSNNFLYQVPRNTTHPDFQQDADGSEMFLYKIIFG
ncbi:hypothetical protein ILYODFUR_017518 [Ilyodon furcidens]|uniref:Uncharacterized protein n=1 Tax=Ilyodon furcidens TaxID=33524 RepID=A0ABV0SN89_9TELE